MTVYTYLGWGTTNENGVAKLDHDANGDAIDHSYTGVGAGEIDVVASLDKPIVEGSVVSNTYPVWDTVFYLECTSETQNWSYNNTRITASFDENGASFVGNESTTFKQIVVTNTSGSSKIYDGTKDWIIEYDVKKGEYPVRCGIWDYGNTQRQILWLGATYGTDWHHCKFVYNASAHTITPYVDNTALTSVDCSNWSMTSFGLCFLDNSSNQMDFTVKGIKVYYG